MTAQLAIGGPPPHQGPRLRQTPPKPGKGGLHAVA